MSAYSFQLQYSVFARRAIIPYSLSYNIFIVRHLHISCRVWVESLSDLDEGREKCS